MTRDEARKLAELALAYAEGRTIQMRAKESANWIDADPKCSIDFRCTDIHNYRVKTDPREWWIKFNSFGVAIGVYREAESPPSENLVHVREVL